MKRVDTAQKSVQRFYRRHPILHKYFIYPILFPVLVVAFIILIAPVTIYNDGLKYVWEDFRQIVLDKSPRY